MRATRFRYLTLALAASLLAGPAAAEPMSDELRDTISRIVILPVDGESDEAVTGTYGKETLGLAGGISKGADMGTVGIEPGGIPIGLPIPFIREIGMIAGGLFGATQRMQQELRDRMAEDLAQQVDQPLSNNALANDVFWNLRNVSSLDPKLFLVTTPIPQDTDAILFVNIDELVLNIQEDEAIVSTSGTVVLKNFADGKTLYRREVKYEDRDKLKNWARNDFVLWREYREFARHYIGRELTAELYERVNVNHELSPLPSGDVKRDKKDDWRGHTRSVSPTLAWDATLSDEKGMVEGAEVLWDLEIYDVHRPVFQAKQLRGQQFTLDVPLEKCKTYRWTVRPTYHRDGARKNGAWMRRSTATKDNGNLGRAISEAHAYIQDFAVLDVDCKAK
jgi:hypothetical protein